MAESIKKFIIKDAHGGTKESGSFSVVGEVHVNIVPGYGEPYAESEYVNGILTITIHNIEGNGITEITTDSQEGDEAVNTVTIKTNANPEGVVLDVRNGSRGNGIASSSEVLSPEDGGTNTHTFTDDDGNEHVFHTKNGQTGKKGDQGDSAVYDPSSPDAPDFVMANTTGQSTTKAMSQKAVTDAITPLQHSINGYDGEIEVHWNQGDVANWDNSTHTEPVYNGQTNVISTEIIVAEKPLTIIPVEGYKYKVWRLRDTDSRASVVVTTTGEVSTITNIGTKLIVSGGKYVEGVFVDMTPNDPKPVKLSYFSNSVESLDAKLKDKDVHGAHVNTLIREETRDAVSNNFALLFDVFFEKGKSYYFTCKSDKDVTVGTGASIRPSVALEADQYNVSGNLKDGKAAVFMPRESGIGTVGLQWGTGKSIESGAKITSSIYLIEERKGILETAKKNEEKLFIGTLGNYSLVTDHADGTRTGNANSANALMMSTCVLPYSPIQIRVKLPKYLKANISIGEQPTWMLYHGTVLDGGVWNIPKGNMFYRVVFGYTDGSNISINDVYDMISDGSIDITYDSNVESLIDTYPEGVMRARAAAYRSVYGSPRTNLPNNLPSFVFTSDIHGDAIRYDRAMKFAELVGADAVLASGDFASVSARQGLTFVDDVHARHSIPALICVGNHDKYDGADAVTNDTVTGNFPNLTDAEVYAALIKPAADRYDYLEDDDTETTSNYYYYDFEDRKIRFIVLNLYEDGHLSWRRHRISETQIEWFISVLTSTPTGYGVMVMSHQTESHIVPLAGFTDFCDGDRLSYALNGVSGAPIQKIIDAFIQKTSATGTYTNEIGTGSAMVVESTETVNWSADFSEVDSTTEFICYVIGHSHCDFVGVVESAQERQIAIDVTCCVCGYGDPIGGNDLTWSAGFSNWSLLPRNGNDATADCFNFFAIDRAAGTIKIARIGSNVTTDLIERKMMVIPYKE